MIEFNGALTEGLLERAQRQHHGRARWVIGLILLIAGIVGFLAQPAPFEPARHFFPIFVGVLGAFILTTASARPPAPENVAIRGSISEQRLSIRVADNEEHLQWSEFSHAVISDDFVLLQRSRFFQHILGREFFYDDASWNEFVSIVRRNVTVIRPQTLPRAAKMALAWLVILAIFILGFQLITRSG